MNSVQIQHVELKLAFARLAVPDAIVGIVEISLFWLLPTCVGWYSAYFLMSSWAGLPSEEWKVCPLPSVGEVEEEKEQVGEEEGEVVWVSRL